MTFRFGVPYYKVREDMKEFYDFPERFSIDEINRYLAENEIPERHQDYYFDKVFEIDERDNEEVCREILLPIRTRLERLNSLMARAEEKGKDVSDKTIIETLGIDYANLEELYNIWDMSEMFFARLGRIIQNEEKMERRQFLIEDVIFGVIQDKEESMLEKL